MFLRVADAGELASAFDKATEDILELTESAAISVAFNTGSARSGSQTYQAKFISKDWSG